MGHMRVFRVDHFDIGFVERFNQQTRLADWYYIVIRAVEDEERCGVCIHLGKRRGVLIAFRLLIGCSSEKCFKEFLPTTHHLLRRIN